MKTPYYLTNIVDNYINGNITEAKKIAAKAGASFNSLRDVLIHDYGYSENKATLTASHMKGADCWQQACDAE